MIEKLFDDYIESKPLTDSQREMEQKASKSLSELTEYGMEAYNRIDSLYTAVQLNAEREAFIAGFKACKELMDDVK